MIVVTGGAGFIGSHLVDKLVSEGADVLVIDDLSTGIKGQVNPKARLIRKDIRTDLSAELKDAEAVFHLAADPEVRRSATEPAHGFDINVRGTFSVLEACRKSDVRRVLLASTSTVYGEAKKIPTPEDHPCVPVSNYGASKLAGEAYIASYAGSYGIKGTTLRFANIFGERSSHGVMFDFYHKLKKNPEKLEILGDGKQDKSYLHVSDCVDALLTAWKKQKVPYDVFNAGSRDRITVDTLARLMCDIMELKPEFFYTGTKRGWAGDVPLMLLDVSKLEALGWKQRIGFKQGMERYLRWLPSSG